MAIRNITKIISITVAIMVALTSANTEEVDPDDTSKDTTRDTTDAFMKEVPAHGATIQNQVKEVKHVVKTFENETGEEFEGMKNQRAARTNMLCNSMPLFAGKLKEFAENNAIKVTVSRVLESLRVACNDRNDEWKEEAERLDEKFVSQSMQVSVTFNKWVTFDAKIKKLQHMITNEEQREMQKFNVLMKEFAKEMTKWKIANARAIWKVLGAANEESEDKKNAARGLVEDILKLANEYYELIGLKKEQEREWIQTEIVIMEKGQKEREQLRELMAALRKKMTAAQLQINGKKNFIHNTGAINDADASDFVHNTGVINDAGASEVPAHETSIQNEVKVVKQMTKTFRNTAREELEGMKNERAARTNMLCNVMHPFAEKLNDFAENNNIKVTVSGVLEALLAACIESKEKEEEAKEEKYLDQSMKVADTFDKWESFDAKIKEAQLTIRNKEQREMKKFNVLMKEFEKEMTKSENFIASAVWTGLRAANEESEDNKNAARRLDEDTLQMAMKFQKYSRVVNELEQKWVKTGIDTRMNDQEQMKKFGEMMVALRKVMTATQKMIAKKK